MKEKTFNYLKNWYSFDRLNSIRYYFDLRYNCNLKLKKKLEELEERSLTKKEVLEILKEVEKSY